MSTLIDDLERVRLQLNKIPAHKDHIFEELLCQIDDSIVVAMQYVADNLEKNVVKFENYRHNTKRY